MNNDTIHTMHGIHESLECTFYMNKFLVLTIVVRTHPVISMTIVNYFMP